MKNSLILSTLLAACTQDNQINEIKGTADTGITVDSGQIDEVFYDAESCMAQFHTADGYYFPSNFPFSVPLDQSGFDEDNVFSEHFTDIRANLFVILGLENMDASISFYDMLIEPETETVTYGNEEFNELTGNFVISSDLGFLPSLNNVNAGIFIVDKNCEEMSGFAMYNFLDSGTEQSSTLMYYLNEMGETVYE